MAFGIQTLLEEGAADNITLPPGFETPTHNDAPDDNAAEMNDALAAASEVEADLVAVFAKLSYEIERLKGTEGADQIAELEQLRASVASAHSGISSVIASASGRRTPGAAGAHARQLRMATGFYGLLASTCLNQAKLEVAEAHEEEQDEQAAENIANAEAVSTNPALDYPVTAYSLPKDQVYQQAEIEFGHVREHQSAVLFDLLDASKNPVPAAFYNNTYTREQLDAAFAPDAAAVNKRLESRVDAMLVDKEMPEEARRVLEAARKIVEDRKRGQQVDYNRDSLALALDKTAKETPETRQAAGAMSYEAEGAYDVMGADGLAGQKEGNAKAIAELEARTKDGALSETDKSTLALLQKRRAQIAVLEEAERVKKELKEASAKGEAAVTANLNHLLGKLEKDPHNKELLAAVDAEAKRIQGINSQASKKKDKGTDKDHPVAERDLEDPIKSAGKALRFGGVGQDEDGREHRRDHGPDGHQADKTVKNNVYKASCHSGS